MAHVRLYVDLLELICLHGLWNSTDGAVCVETDTALEGICIIYSIAHCSNRAAPTMTHTSPKLRQGVMDINQWLTIRRPKYSPLHILDKLYSMDLGNNVRKIFKIRDVGSRVICLHLKVEKLDSHEMHAFKNWKVGSCMRCVHLKSWEVGLTWDACIWNIEKLDSHEMHAFEKLRSWTHMRCVHLKSWTHMRCVHLSSQSPLYLAPMSIARSRMWPLWGFWKPLITKTTLLISWLKGLLVVLSADFFHQTKTTSWIKIGHDESEGNCLPSKTIITAQQCTMQNSSNLSAISVQRLHCISVSGLPFTTSICYQAKNVSASKNCDVLRSLSSFWPKLSWEPHHWKWFQTNLEFWTLSNWTWNSIKLLNLFYSC